MRSQIEIICPRCNKLAFKDKSEVIRQNKKGNPIFCSRKCANEHRSEKRTIHHPIEKECLYCKSVFKTTTRVKARTCCSHECARNYSYKFVNKDNISKSLHKYYQNNPHPKTGKFFPRSGAQLKNRNLDRTYNLICNHCELEFQHLYKNIKFCCKNCQVENRRLKSKSSELSYYRKDCSFKFSLNDFPKEFDFELIKKHGWYSPSNKKNNLNGVSRDHIFSVRDGFERKVSPSIMSHPANCRLMIHSENIQKNKKSDITLEELLDRISKFNKKYNISSS